MHRAWFGLLFLGPAVACSVGSGASNESGAATSTGGATVGVTASAGSGDGSGGLPDTSAETAGAGGGMGGTASVLVCQIGCTQAADCASPGTSLYDANHYECSGGLCQYKGCMSDKDCTSAFQSNNYVCATGNQIKIPACYPKCNTPHDCALASTLYDDDNFACTSGHCEWIGCNTDDECIAGLGLSTYFCDHTTMPFPTCQLTCDMGADCVTNTSDLYSADNFACVANVCRWLGCNSDAECIQATMNGAAVCR